VSFHAIAQTSPRKGTSLPFVCMGQHKPAVLCLHGYGHRVCRLNRYFPM
jgi:hypothetical protein